MIVAIIVPTSCKKDPIQYTFKGTLTDLLTGDGVSGAEVNLSQIVFSNTVINSNYATIANLISDGAGNYEATFNREKVTDFKIELIKNGYFSQENIINPADVSTENDNVFDYILEPKSWIKFDLVNLSPQSSDLLTLVLQNFKSDCPGCASNDYLYFPGAVDTVFKIVTTAGDYAKFIYINDMTGNSTFDSILTIPFDTVNYTIQY